MLSLLVVMLLAPLSVYAGGEIFDVDGAVSRALAHHPDIITAQAEIAAADARQQQAALLFQANPQVEAAGGPRRGDRTTADYSVALSQQVEVGGQRAARVDAAKAQLEASRARLVWQRVEIAAAVRIAFGRVLAAQRLVQVARDGESTAQQAMEAAEKRFRAGDISRIEINVARVERGRSMQERSRAEQEAVVADAELQILLALPPDETLVLRGELPSTAPERPEELTTLTSTALATRADLQAARADLEGARAESALAARQWLPSPRFGASFGQEEGNDIVQGLIGLDLPAFNRNQAGRGIAAARIVQAEQAMQAVRLRAQQEIGLAQLRARIAEQAASAYAAEVVNAMRENLDLSNRAYQASQIDFTQLLLIRRESLAAQRGYIDALEDFNAALAQLHRAIGKE